MKITKFLPILALTLLSAALTNHAQAQDPAHQQIRWKGPMSIQIYSEIIEISALEYAKIMSSPSDSSNDTALRNKLIKQIETGKAKLVSNHLLITRSGEIATIESITEFIHPTNYKPSADTKIKGKPKAAPAIAPPTPSAFETRKLGTTIKVSPIIGNDHKTVGLVIKSEIVKHTSNNIHAKLETKDVKANVTTPNFFTRHLNTFLTLSTGEFTLAGAYAPGLDGKSDNTKKLLHFVKTDILKVGKK